MSLALKKQRFQIGLDILFNNSANVESSILSLLISSTGSLVQKYSGPDSVSVPMELLIRYGDNQDKFEFSFQLFDLAPTTCWGETVNKIDRGLMKDINFNKLAKAVPSLFIKATNVINSKFTISQREALFLDMQEQEIDNNNEPPVCLKFALNEYDDWVRTLLLQKEGLESPLDWEVTLRTSRESFTSDTELCFVFSPGIFSEIAYFTPLGYYRNNADRPLPTTVINVDILFPPTTPAIKGDPRMRCAAHLQNMWTSNPTADCLLNALKWIPELENVQLLDQYSGLNLIPHYNSKIPLDEYVLPDIFAETVKKYGSFRAIYSPAENITWTYDELDSKSNAVAQLLHALGIKSGNVAFMLPRSAIVYVAIIGILKAGCAYVPIDPEYPSDRVAYIISDSESHLLLTHSNIPFFKSTVDSNLGADVATMSESLRLLLPPYTGQVWLLDKTDLTNNTSSVICPAKYTDLAYIIYTSGSTGRPKGVMLEHRNVCALVKAEKYLYKATCDDVVWQGFSIAFDASVEELWVAWANGGTLFCATHEMIHAGPALADIWATYRLSIVSTVPTLLTMLDDTNLGALRILILGGEACHRDLISKWGVGRRMLNTYGPTEATVIATSADCDANSPLVTIGRPIPHYLSYITDPITRQIVPRGVPGELLIGGPGLARGYVNRPDLTTGVFIDNPFRRNDADPDRLYRTGDLCRWSEHGEIEFMGRIDAQVKLRGFRIELAEIESVLMQSDLIHTSVCHVIQVSGAQQLVAFIVPSGWSNADPENLPPLFTPQEEAALKEMLRIRLPPYMVPSIFETLSVIPTLPSGKANRKQLPLPRNRTKSSKKVSIKNEESGDNGYDDVGKESKVATTNLESKILAHVCDLFAQPNLPVSANFFELGGHSVLVARLVSLLRKDPLTATATMADVYNNPNVSSLAAFIESKSISTYNTTQARYITNPVEFKTVGNNSKTSPLLDNPMTAQDSFAPVIGIDYYLCWIMQTILLYLIWAVPAYLVLFAYKFYCWRVEAGDIWWGALFYTFPIMTAFYPVMLMIAVLFKWLLLGKLEPGKHRIWGWWFLRWWFVKKLIEMVPMYPLYGTSFLNTYFRLLGCNIGHNVYLGSTDIYGWDLITIEDNTSVGFDAHIESIKVISGFIILGKIYIGKRCYIGNRAMIIGSSRKLTIMEDDSQLGELSLLPAGSIIPTKKCWSGSPARYFADVPNVPLNLIQAPDTITYLSFLGLKILLFEVLPWFLLIELAPLVCVVYFKDDISAWLQKICHIDAWWLYFVIMPMPTATLSLLTLIGAVILTKWLLIGKWTQTTIKLNTFGYIKKWAYENLMNTLSAGIRPIYSSLYFPPILRALGAQLGPDSEISTATHFTPDLLDIGEGCFIADDVCLGPPVVHLGWMQLGIVKIGERSFIGNSALVPGNFNAASHILIGAMSTGPTKSHAISLPDEAYVDTENEGDSLALSLQDGTFGKYGLIENKEFVPHIRDRSGSIVSGNIPECEVPEQTNWFGAPAIRLPRRIDWSDKFNDVQTFNPPWYMRALRLFIEYFRIVIPVTFATVEFLFFVFYCDTILARLPYSDLPLWNAESYYLGSEFWNFGLLFWPAVMIFSGICSGVLALVFKWFLVGRYDKSEWPLWSSYVWRSELVVALCESLADPMLMNSLRGTPWVVAWLRLMGSNIGSYIYMDSLQITEFDLVTIGDEATIAFDATIQTHLFEDRICKMDQVVVGNYCTVGSKSVVLYCSKMEEGSLISSLSLLMKNESLPAWTQWHGLPASPYEDSDIINY